MRTRFCIAVIAVFVILSVGCSAPSISLSDADDPRIVTDDLGRSVSVPVKIERAVSLAPSLTEMIFAVGAGDRIVGVTTFCNFPDEAEAIQKVGDTQTPNIESIIALKPQVVFVSTASQLEAFMHTLSQQNIAVFVTNPKDLEGVYKNLIQLGEMFSTQQQAESLITDLKKRVQIVRQKQADVGSSSEAKDLARVFIQISNEPLFTIGKESFLTKAVEIAGGVSVTKDVPTAYPKLSKETALALDPEVIFLSDSEDNQSANAVFRNSRAVRNGYVYKIDADIISRPGPRLVDAIEEIGRRLP